MTNLQFALEYLKKGKSVIPQTEDRKNPIAWKKYQEVLPTETEVTEWWTKYPEANIALICGRVSDVVVLDFDVYKDDKGNLLLDSLGSSIHPERKDFALDKFPPTLTVKSTSGGYHKYFKYPGKFKSFYLSKTELVEYKGDGHLITLPPSKRNGKTYHVIENKPIANLPEWVIEKLKIVGERKDFDIGVLNGVESGRRNEAAMDILGKILSRITKNDTEKIKDAWETFKKWNSMNQPPLTEPELRAKFNGILSNQFSKEKEVKKKYSAVTLTKVIEESMAELDLVNPNDCVSFGYPWLDDKITGLFPSELVVLGGSTGVGKTSLATKIIYKASLNQNIKCAVLALEDRLLDYGIKAVYFALGQVRKAKGKTNYPWNEYRKNMILDQHYKEFRKEAEKMAKSDLVHFIKVEEQMNIETLEEMLNTMTKEGFKLFLVDHLHYFDFNRGRESKADYIEQLMVRLKKNMNENGARVILVVHYRKMNGKRPDDDSFKDSISIAQNSNYAIHLWRDKGGEDRYKTIINISKSRNPNGEAYIEVVYNPESNEYDCPNYAVEKDWKNFKEEADAVNNPPPTQSSTDF